jgi:hypothetical protein
VSRFRREDLLTASEIARFVYCHRAWAYDKKFIRQRQPWWQRLKLFWLVLFLLGLIILIALIGLR